jgi:hypothetical protein
MDHSTAQKLMEAYKRIGEALNEADSIIRTLPEDERTAHLRGLGEMMGQLWSKLQLPVVREHRDLDPDGDSYQKKPMQE